MFSPIGEGGCPRVNEMHVNASGVTKGDGMLAAVKDLNEHRLAEGKPPVLGENIMVAGDATNDEELFGYHAAKKLDEGRSITTHVRNEEFLLPGVRALMPWASAELLWQAANFRGTCADLIERVIWAKKESLLAGVGKDGKQLKDEYEKAIQHTGARMAVPVPLPAVEEL